MTSTGTCTIQQYLYAYTCTCKCVKRGIKIISDTVYILYRVSLHNNPMMSAQEWITHRRLKELRALCDCVDLFCQLWLCEMQYVLLLSSYFKQ